MDNTTGISDSIWRNDLLRGLCSLGAFIVYMFLFCFCFFYSNFPIFLTMICQYPIILKEKTTPEAQLIKQPIIHSYCVNEIREQNIPAITSKCKNVINLIQHTDY